MILTHNGELLQTSQQRCDSQGKGDVRSYWHQEKGMHLRLVWHF